MMIFFIVGFVNLLVSGALPPNSPSCAPSCCKQEIKTCGNNASCFQNGSSQCTSCLTRGGSNCNIGGGGGGEDKKKDTTPAPVPMGCVGEKTYTVTFKSFKDGWPEGFSQDAGFNGMIGCSHGEEYTLINRLQSWKLGYEPLMASPGLVDLAESGQTDTLMQELADAYDVLNTATSVEWNSESGEMKMTVTVDSFHTMISWAAKITPSPDWFIGDYIDMCRNGEWAEDSHNIYVTDAGSDSGSGFEPPRNRMNTQEAMEIKACSEDGLCTEDKVPTIGYATYWKETEGGSGCSVLSTMAAILVTLAAAVLA